MKRLHVAFAMALPSVANLREHHMAKATRAKKQRLQAWAELRAAAGIKTLTVIAPLDITLTRVASRPLDTDNLASAFKAVRDGVADWLGIDDGSSALRWHYAQRKGLPKEQAVEILLVDAA